MEIGKQVSGLELSKRLKELKVKQNSLFWWIKSNREEKYFIASVSIPQVDNLSVSWQTEKARCIDGYNDEYSYGIKDYISAFTVAELGEMLPEMMETESIIGADGVKRFFVVTPPAIREKYKNPPLFSDYTEADARAKMLIYLLENKLVDVEEINRRIV